MMIWLNHTSNYECIFARQFSLYKIKSHLTTFQTLAWILKQRGNDCSSQALNLFSECFRLREGLLAASSQPSGLKRGTMSSRKKELELAQPQIANSICGIFSRPGTNVSLPVSNHPPSLLNYPNEHANGLVCACADTRTERQPDQRQSHPLLDVCVSSLSGSKVAR